MHAESDQRGSLKQYIDEVVLEVLEEGVAFVHQAEGDWGRSLKDWNVKVLTDFAGQTLERYDQTPYGIITVDQETMFGDGDNDGFVKVADWDTNTNGSLDSGDSCWGSNPTGDCRLVDFDFDGDVDTADATTLTNLASNDTYRRPGLAYSVTVGNRRTHQGLIHDPETLSCQNRYRQYASSLRQFMQRDPLALLSRFKTKDHYNDGANLYSYVVGNPLGQVDPHGLDSDQDKQCAGYYEKCCHQEGDGYACLAQLICSNTGNSCFSNCTRSCLGARYKCWQGDTMNFIQHYCCFGWCLALCEFVQ